MRQKTIFDKPPASHTDDPPTSAEAEIEHTESGKRGMHSEIVLALVKRHPGSTAVELWHHATETERAELVEMQETRRRLTDLYHAGLVRQCESRLCLARGTKQVTWEAV